MSFLQYWFPTSSACSLTKAALPSEPTTAQLVPQQAAPEAVPEPAPEVALEVVSEAVPEASEEVKPTVAIETFDNLFTDGASETEALKKECALLKEQNQQQAAQIQQLMERMTALEALKDQLTDLRTIVSSWVEVDRDQEEEENVAEEHGDDDEEDGDSEDSSSDEDNDVFEEPPQGFEEHQSQGIEVDFSEIEVDESGVCKEDIEVVLRQLSNSRAEVVSALKKHHGNIAGAIVELTFH